MKIGYAKETGIWFPMYAKEKILFSEGVDKIVCDSINEKCNFKQLCEDMTKGDSLIICGVDDIGTTRNEIEDTWRNITSLGIEIYVVTAPALFYKENLSLDESLIRNITLSMLAHQVEIANQKLNMIKDL